MVLFLSTFTNKVDKKGRISVPAQFRSALAGQSFHGIVAFRSYKYPALEACGIDRMQQLSQSLDDVALFSDEHDVLSSIFADSHQLNFDGEGRIILPEDLLSFAGITENATFVGRGATFQIWEPNSLAEHQAQAREIAKRQGLTLKLRRPSDISEGGNNG